MSRNKSGRFVYVLMNVVRIVLGLVFLFSSVVKGIDPVGTSYRVQDYLQVYGWTALLPYALEITFLIILSEFLLAIGFLFRLFIRTAAKAMLLMLLFFLVVTWFDARYNMVPDCGCFGDAVKLTNWGTFYKNVALLFLNVVFLFWGSKDQKSKRTKGRQAVILVLFGMSFLGFMGYNLYHLPVIDFRAWKTGRDMTVVPQNPKRYVVYENKKTGQQKTFLFPDYPWKDTAWMARWKFVKQYTFQPVINKKYNLVIEDAAGNDCSRKIIEYPGYRFLLVSYNLDKANQKGWNKAAEIARFLKKKKISMVLLTATSREKALQKEKRSGVRFPVYLADETDLKAMIRSNPGLILLHHGVILKKWNFHDFPDTLQLKKILVSPAE